MRDTATVKQMESFVDYFVNYEKERLESHVRYKRLDNTNYKQFRKDLYYLYGHRSWSNADSYISFRDNGIEKRLSFQLAILNWKTAFCTFDRFSKLLWQRIKEVDASENAEQHYQLTLF